MSRSDAPACSSGASSPAAAAATRAISRFASACGRWLVSASRRSCSSASLPDGPRAEGGDELLDTREPGCVGRRQRRQEPGRAVEEVGRGARRSAGLAAGDGVAGDVARIVDRRRERALRRGDVGDGRAGIGRGEHGERRLDDGSDRDGDDDELRAARARRPATPPACRRRRAPPLPAASPLSASKPATVFAPARFAASATDVPTSPVPTTAMRSTPSETAAAGAGDSRRGSSAASCFITSSTAEKSDRTARSESGPRLREVSSRSSSASRSASTNLVPGLLLVLANARDELEPAVQRHRAARGRSRRSPSGARAARESARSCREPFARRDPERQPVRGRRERADPAGVVRARGVVGEVEVEHERVLAAAEVGSLDRIEDVPAAAVGLAPAGRVPERKEDAAAVALEPVDLEGQRLSGQLERRRGERPEQERPAAARVDRPRAARRGRSAPRRRGTPGRSRSSRAA